MTVAERQPKKRRRIMRSFRLEEISCVDRPAQEGARALLIKREESASQQENESDLAKAIRSWLSGYEKRSGVRDNNRQEKEVIMAPASFEAAVQKLRDGGMSATAAMQKVRADHPALYQRFQNEGAEAVAKANTPKGPPAAVLKFRERCEAIQKDRRCSPNEALRRAREAYPEEFAAYQRT
nr:hypothetical protein [Nitrosomonas nitrosa]